MHKMKPADAGRLVKLTMKATKQLRKWEYEQLADDVETAVRSVVLRYADDDDWHYLCGLILEIDKISVGRKDVKHVDRMTRFFQCDIPLPIDMEQVYIDNSEAED